MIVSGSCHDIKHVDAWECTIVTTKADNNPKAEPSRLIRSGCFQFPLSDALRATTSMVTVSMICIVGKTKHYLLFQICPHNLSSDGCERSLCHHWYHLPLRNTPLLDYKQQPRQTEMSSFGFCMALRKRGLGNQITEPLFHRHQKPQGTQTVPHRLLTMLTPPFLLLLLICLDLLQN